MLILDLICYMSTGLFNKLLSSGHVLLLLLCGCLLGCLFSGFDMWMFIFKFLYVDVYQVVYFFRFDMWMFIRLFIFRFDMWMFIRLFIFRFDMWMFISGCLFSGLISLCLSGCLFSGWICGCLSSCLFSGLICGCLSGCLFFRLDMWMFIRLFIFQVGYVDVYQVVYFQV